MALGGRCRQEILKSKTCLREYAWVVVLHRKPTGASNEAGKPGWSFRGYHGASLFFFCLCGRHKCLCHSGVRVPLGTDTACHHIGPSWRSSNSPAWRVGPLLVGLWPLLSVLLTPIINPAVILCGKLFQSFCKRTPIPWLVCAF